MRTRILIPFLAAALLVPAAGAPVSAGEDSHRRGGHGIGPGHVQHERERHVKRHGFDTARPHLRPALPPRVAHVGRPYAHRGWFVPPRPRVFVPPPRFRFFAAPPRPRIYAPPPRHRIYAPPRHRFFVPPPRHRFYGPRPPHRVGW